MHGEECSARHTCPHLAHMKEGSVGFHRICIAFLMPLSAHWSPLFSSFGRFLPKNNRLQGRGLRAFRSTQKNNSTLIGGLRFFLLIKMVCEDGATIFLWEWFTSTSLAYLRHRTPPGQKTDSHVRGVDRKPVGIPCFDENQNVEHGTA
jgi:hypothetical protein